MDTPLGLPVSSYRSITDLKSDFWKDATFLPLDRPSRIDALLAMVHKSRQAAFVAFFLRLFATQRDLCEQTGISECFEKFKLLTAEQRQRLIEYPPFLIWLKISLACSSDDERRENLPDLTRIMDTFELSKTRRPVLTMNGSQIQVTRFDVDPLIKKAALPEYRFPDETRLREFEANVAYPTSFFVEMLTLALERIRRAWPAAYLEFFKVVRQIVDMVDADFTSYSGANHVGVIFVSTDNSPLVALEEYLIHELGHQILYNVMSLDPVVINEPEEIFTLPWSGQQRDLPGYFHAFYIYSFMAHYLQRVHSRSKREQKRVAARFSQVSAGLERAERELEDLNRFTPIGKRLFENLKHIKPVST